MKEIQDIWQVYQKIRDREEGAVLATVISVKGSSYRAPGARMLITAGRKTVGTLGAGCFEEDLLERTQAVFDTGKPMVIEYDTTPQEEVIWGLGLGCQGVVKVLLEHLPGERDFDPILFMKDCWERETLGRMATVIEVEGELDIPLGSRILALPEKDLVRHSSSLLTLTQTVLENPGWDDRTSWNHATISLATGRVELLLEKVEPLVLAVLGGGPDAIPLTHLASELGWRIKIFDHRKPYIAERFPHCHQVTLTNWDDMDQHLHPHSNMAVVIMTHNYLTDAQLLEKLLPSSAFYLGLIGPSRRREALLGEVRKKTDIPTAQLRKLYGPSGLDLGSETPQEIALSIAAEIQARRAGRLGGYLKDREGAIHSQPKKIMTTYPPFAAIILAAGGSRRLGQPKQMLLHQGKSLIWRTIEAAQAVNPAQIVVVVGGAAEEMKAHLQGFAGEICINSHWETGMASSLVCGVEALEAAEQPLAGVLLLICDQIFLTGEVLSQLVETHWTSGKPLVACEYGDSVGVPIWVSREFFSHLKGLQGDRGARKLLHQFEPQVAKIPFPQGHIDIDTEEDLTHLE